MATMRSAEYWAMRAESRLASVERGSEKYLKQMMANNVRASQQIEADIKTILNRFATNSNMTIDEAMEVLKTPIGEKERQRIIDAAMQIEDLEERARVLAPVNAPAYAARIDHLKAVELTAEARLKSIAPDQIGAITGDLQRAGREMYMKTIYDLQVGTGLGFSFADVTEKRLESVIKHKWVGKHYSARVWDNTEIISERIRDLVQHNVTTGRSWRRSLADIRDLATNQSNYSAARLLRTETAHVIAEMEAEAYEESGLKEYEYLSTLDTRTSDICRELDGKRFKLKDRQPGVNYPPMHAFCRSTTVAVIPGFSMDALERRARDPETGEVELVPASMSYKEWEKHHAELRASRPDRLNKPDTKLQKTLADDRILGIVPKHVDLANVKVIAGSGVKKIIREEPLLIKDFGGRQGQWQKITADVITDNFKYQVHYYERDGVQYKVKMKSRKEIRQ